MKQLIALLTIFTFYQTYAQEPFVCAYNGYQTVEKVGAACDYVGAELNFGSDASSAEQYVDKILDNIGLFRNFYVEECVDINNAYAVTLPQKNGAVERYILYDEAFFEKVKKSTAGNWGLISILAHEVGHHLNGHTLTGKGSNHQTELQADEFSGFVLARMKCTLEDAQAAITKMLPDKASATHPAKADRLAAVEKGWNRGNGKTIKVKKITNDIKKKILSGNEDDEDVKNITAEQILANHVEAIGGEEKIKSIKTLEEKATRLRVNRKNKKEEHEIITKYLTPSIEISEEYDKNSQKTSYRLERNPKVYMKEKASEKWKKTGETIKKRNSISYINEFFNLVSNTKINFLGIKEFNGKKCYVVESMPKKEKMKVMGHKMDVTRISQKYYDVENFLGVYGTLILKGKIKWKQEKIDLKISYNVTISNYKKVDGIYFPFTVKSNVISNFGGKTFQQKEIYNKTYIKINPPLNPEDFKVN